MDSWTTQIARAEQTAAREALKATNGSVRAAAKLLQDISERNLWRKIERYGIDRDEYRQQTDNASSQKCDSLVISQNGMTDPAT